MQRERAFEGVLQLCPPSGAGEAWSACFAHSSVFVMFGLFIRAPCISSSCIAYVCVAVSQRGLMSCPAEGHLCVAFEKGPAPLAGCRIGCAQGQGGIHQCGFASVSVCPCF